MRLHQVVPAISVLPWHCMNNDDYEVNPTLKKKKYLSGLTKAKLICKQHIAHKMQEVGAPGMVVAVSVDGVTLWSEGFGLADVENHVPCTPRTVMRVASISKPFTATAMARLWEDGKLDLDKPIQEYLPAFPEKCFDGEKVSITLRQLLSHTSGIRHYHQTNKSENSKTSTEFELKDYLITKQYDNVTDALEVFKDDPLLKKPGQEYLYTTHAWTVISAILEEVSGREFLTLMQDNFRLMGMHRTEADRHGKLVYGRARYYRRGRGGKLVNAPYVNNSWKWAGGGFLSTVGDLIKFGNIMMYSFQLKTAADGSKEIAPGLLRSETVKKMWNVAVKCKREKKSNGFENTSYGLGWVVFPEMEQHGLCPESRLEVAHSGGAIGASSILYLLPSTGPHRDRIYVSSHSRSAADRTINCSNPTTEDQLSPELVPSESVVGPVPKQVKKKSNKKDKESTDLSIPDEKRAISGIAVAILTNMESVGLTALARTIAHEFDGTLRAD